MRVGARGAHLMMGYTMVAVEGGLVVVLVVRRVVGCWDIAIHLQIIEYIFLVSNLKIYE